MQINSFILVSLIMHIGLILAFSWLGIKLINSYCLKTTVANDQLKYHASRIVLDSAVILPKLRKLLRMRRMIKSDSDNDDSPFCLLSFVF